MSTPAVNITEQDGNIGVAQNGLSPMAIIGATSAGTANLPTPISRKEDLAAFGVGACLERAAYHIEVFNRPVLLCKTGDTTAGSFLGLTGAGTDEPTFTGTGTSAVTIDTAVEPLDDFEPVLIVKTGGTIGVAGIVLQYSLDGGRTLSGDIALGTATSYTIPSSGVKYDFAAGDLDAGDQVDGFVTRAPSPNATEIGEALTALKQTNAAFEGIACDFPLDAALFDAVETGVESMRTAGNPQYWIGHFRLPNIGESEAAYLAAFDTALSAKSTVQGCVTAGSAEITSGLTGRKYVRPVDFRVSAHQSAVLHHIDIADVNLGAATGVTLRDANGNPKYHDEAIHGGLDDARATTLRTWGDPQGVYVNRPRIFSPSGSDFYLIPHRRVMNLAYSVLLAYFVRRLNRPVRVNLTTGYIREEEAQEIERGADAVVRAALMDQPRISGGGFSRGRFVQLSRTDNLLTTKTLTGQARIVPLAYPEFANIALGFYNPALQLVA